MGVQNHDLQIMTVYSMSLRRLLSLHVDSLLRKDQDAPLNEKCVITIHLPIVAWLTHAGSDEVISLDMLLHNWDHGK